MPSDFETLFRLTASPLMDRHQGEAVGYVTRGGRVVDGCIAIWNPEDFAIPHPDDFGKTESASGTAFVRKEFFERNEINPKRGDTLSIDGKAYAALGVLDSGDGWYQFNLSAVERIETGDGATRGRNR